MTWPSSAQTAYEQLASLFDRDMRGAPETIQLDVAAHAHRPALSTFSSAA